jgi:single-stranded-DNA-specific exonuclease
VLLIAFEEDGRGRASARGVPGFELHHALSACSEHLVAHGGHAQAAGFEIERARLQQFQAAMEAYAREASDEEIGRSSLDIDCEVELEELAEPVVLELARMEPFGAGNPPPLLACRGLEVAGVPRRVGAQGDHLKFIARQGATTVSAIAFGCGHLQERLSRGVFDAAFTPSMNEFNGRREVQMDIRDLSLPDAPSLQR